MHVIVAGCGRVGSQLALNLAFEGHDVVVIDTETASFDRLGTAFNGVTLEGVAFEEEVLKEAGVEKADAFAAVTNHDNTNLMAAEVAIHLFGVPRVVARLYNPDKELTFRQMGVDYVCGTTMLADHLREKLLRGEVAVEHEAAGSGMRIIEFTVSPPSEGKSLGCINDGRDTRLLTLVRGNRELKWGNDTSLSRGDRVVVAVTEQGWGDVWDFLAEEPASRGERPGGPAL